MRITRLYAGLAMLICAALPARGTVVTIDDLNANNAAGDTFSVTGIWNTYTDAQAHSTFFTYHAAGTGLNVAKWQPTLPAAGDYDVSVWYPALITAATNAPFTIDYNGGSQPVPVNERINGGTWFSLGTFTFAAGTSGDVRLSDAGNGNALADAVRFSSVPEPTGLALATGSLALALRRRGRR